MRTRLLPAVTLLAATSSPVAASSRDTSRVPAVATVVNIPSFGCPLEFSAHRQSAMEFVRVRRYAKQRFGQGVQILFLNSSTTVTAAQVVVHAFSNRTRLLPVNQLADDADLSRPFQLSAPAKEGGVHVSDIWVEGAGSIVSVDLVSAVYADGSVWHGENGASCHVPVHGYMPVRGE